MNHLDFEQGLRRGIPLGVGASFYQSIKTAGWGDPPDETGVLEGQFTLPLEQVLAKLTEVASAKFKLMVAYHIYAESMRGVAQHAVAEVFHEHAEQERAAAEAYLKRAAVLGGGPIHLPEIETPPASSDPVGILMIVVRAEQEAIALQHALKQMVGDANPLTFQIEQFMIEDQHHCDEAWQMLPQDVQRELAASGPEAVPAEAGAPVPAPAPVEGEPESAPPTEAPPDSEQEPTVPSVPKPQRQPKPRGEGEKEPSAEKKEAFARGLRKLQKQAGMATKTAGDLIQFPGRGERALRGARKGLGELARGAGKRVLQGFGSLPLPARVALGAGGLGAALGGLQGAGLSLGMDEEAKAEALKKNGPIGRYIVEHPVVGGMAMGGTSAALSGGTLAALRHSGPAVALPASMLAGMGAPIGMVAVDRALKNREQAAEAEPKVAAAFQRALRKLGYSGPTEPGFGTDPATAPQPNAGVTVSPQASMEAPGPQPPMANPPGSQQYEPVNYLEAERVARQAQEQNEAGFYRNQAQQHASTVQSMGEQVQAIQEQLDQLQAQAAESNSQIMAANAEASQANDQMLTQATLAARMRMGMQQLRARRMEIASQDPEQLAAAAGGPTPMDVGNQAAAAAGGPAGAPTGLNGEQAATAPPDQAEPGTQPGQPGTAESGGQAPGSPQPGAGAPSDTKDAPEESNASAGEPAKKDNAETTVSIKKGSSLMDGLRYGLPGAALGAAGGAVAGARSGRQVESLRDKVDAMKGQPETGGFDRAINLAHAHLQLAQAEQARANPGRAALSGGLRGAGLGFALGASVPGALDAGRAAVRNVHRLRNPL